MLSPLRALRVITESYRHSRWEAPGLSHSDIKAAWAKKMLDTLQIELTITGTPTAERPALLVGNHVSYLDIVLLIAAMPDASFVAKQELAAWPVFGSGARRFDTIFVQRSSAKARGHAFRDIERALTEDKRAVALFPSGTTTLDEAKPWKFGAFRLAHSLGIPLQVFRLSYEPLRRAAYIDRDFFPSHLLHLCRGGPIRAKLEFAEATKIQDPIQDCARWREWTGQIFR